MNYTHSMNPVGQGIINLITSMNRTLVRSQVLNDESEIIKIIKGNVK